MLLAATCFASPTHYHGLDVRPLNPQTFFVNEAGSRASYAYDGVYEYIGTAQGLYRTLSIASETAGAFDLLLGGKVNQVVFNNGVLNVLLEGGENPGPSALNHTLLISTDQGRTFRAIDEGLEECAAGYCRFLPVNQIDFAPNGMRILSAGGNLLVQTSSPIPTLRWKPLYPSSSATRAQMQACPIVFARTEQRVVIAGECPLDFGYVANGTLTPNLFDWQVQPRRLSLPDEIPQLENRNAQFVAAIGEDVFVGVEGGLLKSCDNGTSFRYVMRFPLESRRYPYPHQFLAPVKYPNARILAGFDKGTSGPFLAWSPDGGETWIDASGLLPPDGTVALLTERRDGLPMIFVQRGTTLSMMQLVLSELPLRRRGVRH